MDISAVFFMFRDERYAAGAGKRRSGASQDGTAIQCVPIEVNHQPRYAAGAGKRRSGASQLNGVGFDALIKEFHVVGALIKHRLKHIFKKILGNIGKIIEECAVLNLTTDPPNYHINLLVKRLCDAKSPFLRMDVQLVTI